MDYKEEQNNEVEALEHIYCGELEGFKHNLYMSHDFFSI